MEYKILIKYTSTIKKDFYCFYIDPETEKEFITTDLEILNKTINALDKIYGNKDIRIIADVNYDVNILVKNIEHESTPENPPKEDSKVEENGEMNET